MIDKIRNCHRCHGVPEHNIDDITEWDGYWVGCCAIDNKRGDNETAEHSQAFSAINQWNNMQLVGAS